MSFFDRKASPWGCGKDRTRVESKTFRSRCERWNKLAKTDFERWKFAVYGCQHGEYDSIEPYRRHSVFPSICDQFDDWDDGSGLLSRLRADMFETIDACPFLDFYLLTKRPENIRGMWRLVCGIKDFNSDSTDSYQTMYEYRHNVFLLTSVSDQSTADAMIPLIHPRQDLCRVVGISAEPLLGPIDLRGVKLGWCIIGCESGHGRRPMQQEWAESLVDQCRDLGIPCFMKQMDIDGRVSGNLFEFPKRLQVREWPE